MPPTLADLTRRFLAAPTEHADREVEAYDVASAFRVDPRAAWEETLAVPAAFGLSAQPVKMPSEWARNVNQQAPAQLIPMALGLYPQMVSDLASLLARDRVRPVVRMPEATAAIQAKIGPSDAMTINEEGVAALFDGQIEQAVAHWQELPDCPGKAFNLGVGALAQSDFASAQTQLSRAAEKLIEDSGWQSLAKLYLALASNEL